MAKKTQEVTTKSLEGIVHKISNSNTIKVRVEQKAPHPIYHKVVKTHRNFLVHVEDSSQFVVGQAVNIKPGRPVSKMKSWFIA